MDLRQNQLPWSEQIWAKINADLAQALTQARRIRAPFEIVHVPSSQQTISADSKDIDEEYLYAESETLPIIELCVPIRLQQSQVFNEGENFFCLDRIISAAFELGNAEDKLLMYGSSTALPGNVRVTPVRQHWEGIRDHTSKLPTDLSPVVRGFGIKRPLGLEVFNAVVAARSKLRIAQRYEPFALFVSNSIEGALQSTIPGSNSLNTPLERMRGLVSAGIHTSPILPIDSAVVISTARSWVDIVQALEPSIQFLNIGNDGHFELRLIERFALRLKDRSARCAIYMKPNFL